MIPIQKLLSRIRWDEDFGKGDFVVGYYDRVADEIRAVPFQEILWDQDHHASMQLKGMDGAICAIPWHRVRRVWKDGQLIWQRPQE
ncbi:MAG: DUF504 domain-containing protein [Desulfurivibrionaceae bacterium]|nr:DUF504 domain-containing protein [Desulfurivibrionaceae bacterium]